MRRFALLALLIATAAATTIVPLPVERLAQLSSQVVRARALDSRSEWQGGRIYTYTRFQVLERWKGSAAEVITVKQPGGSAGGYTQRVAGVRGWRQGEETVLFLRPAGDGALAVTGLMQGDFRIRQDASGRLLADNGVAGVQEFESGARTVREFRGERLTLSELRERVQRAGAR